MFHDVSTLIDMLFPKFEFGGGGYYICFDGDLTFLRRLDDEF
jgi:hypothetical protein